MLGIKLLWILPLVVTAQSSDPDINYDGTSNVRNQGLDLDPNLRGRPFLQPGADPISEPEFYPQREPLPDLIPEPIAQPEPLPDSIPEPIAQPESFPDSIPEPIAQLEPLLDSIAEPITHPEPSPDSISESIAQPEPSPDSIPEPIAQPESSPDSIPEPIAQSEPSTDSIAEPIAQPESSPDSIPEPIAQSEPSSDSIAEPIAQPEPSPDSIAEPIAQSEPSTDSIAEPIAQPEPSPDSTPEPLSEYPASSPEAQLELTSETIPPVTTVGSTTYRPHHGGLLVKDFDCDRGNGYYAVEKYCDSYIECKDNIAVKYFCPDGLHFKQAAKWKQYPCAYPSEVKCGAGAEKQNAKPTNECPRRYGFFSMKDGECSKYITCQEGRATVMDCPYGLVFNAVTSSCDWPENVPLCNPNAFKDLECPNSHVDQDGKISDFSYKYRYGSQCKLYVACQRGHPRLLSCDPGLLFDEPSQSCIDADLVTDCA